MRGRSRPASGTPNLIEFLGRVGTYARSALLGSPTAWDDSSGNLMGRGPCYFHAIGTLVGSLLGVNIGILVHGCSSFCFFSPLCPLYDVIIFSFFQFVLVVFIK